MIADASYADTVLRDRAVEALKAFASEHGLPVERSQMAGLRQMAANEPGPALQQFIANQRDKAQRRFQSSGQKAVQFQAEVKFWEMVRLLCAAPRTQREWSLEQDAAEAVPAELRGEKLPPGAKLSREDQVARRQRDERREAFLKAWRLRAYPAFFQHFCAEYLYRKALNPEEDRRHEDEPDR